jgi:glutamate N-acetyltransferase/amino-acid N-acetyltransferase
VAVNLPEPGPVAAVPGVALAVGAAAIKAADRDDLALLVFDPGTSVAGVFTQSSFKAAPVLVAQQAIARGDVRALLINSGNANAATGAKGLEDARQLCAEVGRMLEIDSAQVAPFSTGVIGERLPVERMSSPVRALPRALQADGWRQAARAIMTTDTVPKLATSSVRVGGRPVTITGMSKGAGMIRPDMATMLAFVCCDAAVEPPCLQSLVEAAAQRSFNRITVDGDTSTNDAFILAATGAAGNEPLSDPASADARALLQGLESVSRSLAQAIVRDGEGATKFVTVEVSGGASEAECLKVAYTVGESPLVKTALFASDPNWGRVAMAVGRAGVKDLDVAGVSVWFDDVAVIRGGVMAPDYSEARGAGVLAADEFTIRIDLGRGAVVAEIWTSDFSYDYVRINAEYRT